MNSSARLDLGVFSRRSVRPINQAELAECGLASLAMVVNYHGLDTDLSTLRRKFAPSMRGMTLRTLISVADRLDFECRPLRLDLEDLSALQLPAILHWNLNHFVVLEKISGNRAFIHDPAGRSGWQPLSKVSDHFTGVALELQPSATFQPREERQSLSLWQLWTNIRGLKRTLAQAVLLSLILQAIVLVSPYYLQLVIDKALPEADLGLLGTLAIGFGLLVIINSLASILRQSVILFAGATFSFDLSANLARKLFRLPVDWFARRPVGDILTRFQSVFPLRQMLTEDAAATLVDGLLAFLTLALMFFYSPLLALVVLLAVAAYALVRVFIFGPQKGAQNEMIVAGGREQSVLIESIRGMRSIRLSGRETLRHSLWQSRMADATNANVRFRRLTNWQNVLRDGIYALDLVIVVWLAVQMIMAGQMSVGMLLAFLAYRSQFEKAATTLVDSASAFRLLGLHLDRLSDIALAGTDISFEHDPSTDRAFRGKIELRDVSYRYGPNDPLVLKNVNIVIQEGESVAITGPSGGGKSTLVQVMLGLTEPTEGLVLVDDVPLRSFGYQNFRHQISAVLQDDTLFAGSIVDNITMFEETVDMDRVKSVSAQAAIDTDIDAMPMGYETLVGDMGSALSGGQRQRILLARALYRSPRLLIADEGTSHLDAVRERQVSSAVAELGITRLIIAHRKETLSTADRLYILSEGQLVEATAEAV